MKRVKLPAQRICKDEKCRTVHDFVSDQHQYDSAMEIYYWNCPCGTTMTYMPDRERTISLIRCMARKKTNA